MDFNITDDEEDEIITEYQFSSRTTDYICHDIVEHLRNGRITVPKFQRANNVWQTPQRSRLILSLIKNIPIPPIYLFVNGSGIEIIDGLQRITAVSEFLNGNLTLDLKGTKYHGKKFDRDDKDVNFIGNKSISAVYIQQEKPDENNSGKYEIFKILNQSSTPLNAQEVRRCIYESPFTDFLTELNGDVNWRKIYDNSSDVNNGKNRYKDEEIILRAFVICFTKLDDVSSLTSAVNNFLSYQQKNYDTATASKIKTFFTNATKELATLIDKPINTKAILDAILASVIYKYYKGIQTEITKDSINLLLNDSTFKKHSSSGGTGKISTVKDRFEIAKQILLQS